MSNVNSNIENYQLISKVVMAKKFVLLSPHANGPLVLPPGGSKITIVLTDICHLSFFSWLYVSM